MLNSLVKVTNNLKCHFVEHLKILSGNLDPLKDYRQKNRSFVKNALKHSVVSKHYAFAFAVSFYVALDMAAVLEQNNFAYSSKGLPDLFTHKVFPEELWPQSDIVMNLGFFMGFFVYFTLMNKCMLKHKFIMFFVGNKNMKTFKIYMNNRGTYKNCFNC